MQEIKDGNSKIKSVNSATVKIKNGEDMRNINNYSIAIKWKVYRIVDGLIYNKSIICIFSFSFVYFSSATGKDKNIYQINKDILSLSSSMFNQLYVCALE